MPAVVDQKTLNDIVENLKDQFKLTQLFDSAFEKCSDQQEIRKTYRAIALKTHRDKGGNDDAQKLLVSRYEMAIKKITFKISDLSLYNKFNLYLYFEDLAAEKYYKKTASPLRFLMFISTLPLKVAIYSALFLMGLLPLIMHGVMSLFKAGVDLITKGEYAKLRDQWIDDASASYHKKVGNFAKQYRLMQYYRALHNLPKNASDELREQTFATFFSDGETDIDYLYKKIDLSDADGFVLSFQRSYLEASCGYTTAHITLSAKAFYSAFQSASYATKPFVLLAGLIFLPVFSVMQVIVYGALPLSLAAPRMILQGIELLLDEVCALPRRIYESCCSDKTKDDDIKSNVRFNDNRANGESNSSVVPPQPIMQEGQRTAFFKSLSSRWQDDGQFMHHPT